VAQAALAEIEQARFTQFAASRLAADRRQTLKVFIAGNEKGFARQSWLA
jgi:hypothetical protein